MSAKERQKIENLFLKAEKELNAYIEGEMLKHISYFPKIHTVLKAMGQLTYYDKNGDQIDYKELGTGPRNIIDFLHSVDTSFSCRSDPYKLTRENGTIEETRMW